MSSKGNHMVLFSVSPLGEILNGCIYCLLDNCNIKSKANEEKVHKCKNSLIDNQTVS